MALIEIDPAFPVLWRGPRALQIGEPPVCPVVEDAARWQVQLIESLVSGIPDGYIAGVATAFGAQPAEAAAFVAALGPALREAPVQRALTVVVADEVPEEAVLGVLDALDAAGFDATRATAAEAAADASRLAVVVGGAVVPPHIAHRLMAADRPHLPIALAPHAATVGPLVRPGRTACLACLWEHERERDPLYPTIAAQLVARAESRLIPRSIASAAAGIVARILAADDPHAERTRSVRITRDGRRRWRSHRPSAACLCRSPRGSEMPIVRIVPRSAPTTATASARPA